MRMGDRSMPGIVEAEARAITDPALRNELLGLALAFVDTLPPK